jgi:hypothetical protein
MMRAAGGIGGGAGVGMARFGIALLVLGLTLAGCGQRNAAPVTPCVGDAPAIERIKDVAPPNCGPVGP